MTCPHPDRCPDCDHIPDEPPWTVLGEAAPGQVLINEPCPVCGQLDGAHDLGRHVASGALLTTYPEES